MSNSPVLVAVLEAGRPENMAVILSALFVFGTIYILRRSPMMAERLGAIVSALGVVLPISVWFAIQNLTRRANDNVPDMSIPRLDANAWLITLFLMVIAIVTIVFCLKGKVVPGTTLNWVAVVSGCVMLVLASVSLATGCTVLTLANNASALKVWALLVWQHCTVFTAVVGLIFVIAAPLAIRAHRRYNRELAAKQANAIERMLAGQYGTAKNTEK